MRSFLLVSLFACPLSLQAQTPTASGPQTTELHLLKQTDPVYPAIARAARVSGPVVIKVTVGPDGHVVHLTVVSGPPMLVGAALECVQEWIYEPPTQDGKPTEATTLATVDFPANGLKPRADQKIMDKFWPLERTCMEDISSNAAPAKKADQCRQAAEVASTFDPTERYEVRRNAYAYASTAFLHNHQTPEALEYANKAVEVTEQGHLGGAPAAAAYGIRAQVEATSGNLVAASRDLDLAEQNQRLAIDNISPKAVDSFRRGATGMLKRLLTLHAQVLTAQGKSSEAEAKTAEAAKLQS